MGRQRSNPQMKEKKEVSETMLNEIEASQLSDTCLLYTSDAADD